MKTEDFIYTIGYQGDTAMVGKTRRRNSRGQSARQLAEAGLYKPAFCRALVEGDEGTLEFIRKNYNENALVPYESLDQMKRLFGVFAQPVDITKSKEV